MFIPFSTFSTFLIYFLSIFGSIFLIYAIIKSNQIKKFEGKRLNNYYKEIPAYFLQYAEPQYKKKIAISKKSYTFSHAIFSYEIDGDEFLYQGKQLINKYSMKECYPKEQRITLYQDPKTGKVFESLCNDEPEVRRFTINGIVMLAFAFLIFSVKYL